MTNRKDRAFIAFMALTAALLAAMVGALLANHHNATEAAKHQRILPATATYRVADGWTDADRWADHHRGCDAVRSIDGDPTAANGWDDGPMLIPYGQDFAGDPFPSMTDPTDQSYLGDWLTECRSRQR